jgi:type IX secretion system PorP/SprF family membrane protein
MAEMKNLQKLALMAASVLSAQCLVCQQQTILNQTAYNLYVLSPAAAGIGTVSAANCHYKRNWVTMQQGPETFQLTLDGPVQDKNIGIGLNLRAENAGLLSVKQISGAFRYGLKVNSSSSLSFGLGAGFARTALDFAGIRAEAPEEFADWQQAYTVLTPVLGSGIAFRSKRMVIDCSAGNLLPASAGFKSGAGEVFNYRSLSDFALVIQRTFPAGKHFAIMPSCILRSTYGLPVQPDLLINLIYGSAAFLGCGYRPDNAVYFNLGCSLGGGVRAIYSYEFSVGEQMRAGAGHEISLRFSLQRNAPISQPADLGSRNLRELLEKMDEHNESENDLKETIDSLDKNLRLLREEIERLKSRQLSQEEIVKAVDDYFERHDKTAPDKQNNSSSIAGRKPDHSGTSTGYRIVNPETEKDYVAADSAKGSCRIVLGVYQLANYAREYQKFLKREMGYDTRLVQLTLRDKTFIYVCLPAEYDQIGTALSELKRVRSNVSARKITITKGQPWILQKIIR